jgi:hypothetical protein
MPATEERRAAPGKQAIAEVYVGGQGAELCVVVVRVEEIQHLFALRKERVSVHWLGLHGGAS